MSLWQPDICSLLYLKPVLAPILLLSKPSLSLFYYISLIMKKESGKMRV